jgi:hypothetical protein
MNNDNTPIHCAKVYQIRSNELSRLAAKVNTNIKNPHDRVSAFMLGKKKAQVVQSGRTIHLGDYHTAHSFLTQKLAS